VYLIDEVHMLSTHSFNALLKTLEEPPPHMKFLLATTDPQKLPATVLSRCLQFNLKRMPVGQIAEHMKALLEKEGVPFEPAGLRLVAQAADGSMRDGLSLLDQLIAFGGGKAGEEEARAMLGTISRDHVERLAELLGSMNVPELMQCSRSLEEFAPDYAQVLDELAGLLVRVAMKQTISDFEGDDLYAPELLERLAKALSPEDIQLFYQTAITGRRDLALAPDPRTGFEMTLLRMIAFRPANDAGAGQGPATGSGNAAGRGGAAAAQVAAQAAARGGARGGAQSGGGSAAAGSLGAQAGGSGTGSLGAQAGGSGAGSFGAQTGGGDGSFGGQAGSGGGSPGGQGGNAAAAARAAAQGGGAGGAAAARAAAQAAARGAAPTGPGGSRGSAAGSSNGGGGHGATPQSGSGGREVVNSGSASQGAAPASGFSGLRDEGGAPQSGMSQRAATASGPAGGHIPGSGSSPARMSDADAEAEWLSGHHGEDAATTPAAAIPGGAAGEADASWIAILNQLDLQGAARQLASHCVLIGHQPGLVRLALDPRVKFVRTSSQEEKLAQALSRHYGETVRLEFTTASGEAETPAQAEQRASQQELDVARQAFETDPAVKSLRERFGATLLPDTIRPVK
jgi:DNA polymerase-3 subunit gamma/tau